MIEYLCLIISIAVTLFAFILGVTTNHLPRGKRGSLSLSKWLIIGVFCSCVCIHFPMYVLSFSKSNLCLIKSVIASIHHSLRVFILDGELDPIVTFSAGLDRHLALPYTICSMFLYILAPILTFSAVLSLIKRISGYWRLLFHQFSETFIFSELNKNSLALAKSLRNNHRHSLLIFTDVFEENDEETFELCEQARELNCVLFRCDISKLKLQFHKKTNHISFFIIGTDESEGVQQALSLIDQYKNEEKMRLYIFATGVESRVLFQSSSKGKMNVRRINIVRSLINQNLYENGIQLFDNAIQTQNGKRIIGVVIAGLGQYGTEMLKALTWCCQMDGYQIRIDAFDIDTNANDTFAAKCPELMAPERNGVTEPGEAEYLIKIHSGTDINSLMFDNKLKELPYITHVFVSLGEDATNIAAAIRIREVCERCRQKPIIQAIISDTQKAKNLEGITNFKGQRYNIDFLGDVDGTYSEEVVINSELENAALKRHLFYDPTSESTFWAFEYNYQSSIASTIHSKLRCLCKIPGAEKPRDQRTPDEQTALELLEHKRWNAFMRAEGYRYGGTIEKAGRNDMAKLHNLLVPFDLLPESEKKKDDI